MWECPRCGAPLVKDYPEGFLVCPECGNVVSANVAQGSYLNHQFLDGYRRTEEKLRRKPFSWRAVVSTEPGDTVAAERARYWLVELLRTPRTAKLVGVVKRLPAYNLDVLYYEFLKAVSGDLPLREAIKTFGEACKLGYVSPPDPYLVDRMRIELEKVWPEAWEVEASNLTELFKAFLSHEKNYVKARRAFEEACRKAGVKPPDLAPTAVFTGEEARRRIEDRRERLEEAWRKVSKAYGEVVEEVGRAVARSFPEFFQPLDPEPLGEAVASWLGLTGEVGRRAKTRLERLRTVASSAALFLVYRLGVRHAAVLRGIKEETLRGEISPSHASRYAFCSVKGGRRPGRPLSETTLRVLELLLGGPMSPVEVSEATGISRAHARVILSRLKRRGLLEKAGGRYKILENRLEEVRYLLYGATNVSRGENSRRNRNLEDLNARRTHLSKVGSRGKEGESRVRNKKLEDRLDGARNLSIVRDSVELVTRYETYGNYVKACRKLLVEPLPRREFLGEKFLEEKLPKARRAFRELVGEAKRERWVERRLEAARRAFSELLSAPVQVVG